MVLDCGHEATLPKPGEPTIATGYGIFGGKKYCYACCAERDKEQMRKEGKIDLYLMVEKLELNRCGNVSFVAGVHRVKDGGNWVWHKGIITNWPGSLILYPYNMHKGKHRCFGGYQERWDVWFAFEGATWHGIQRGNHNQILRCKRLKEKQG